MKRRRYIGTFAALSVAGCLGRGSADLAGAVDGTDDGAATDDPDGPPCLEETPTAVPTTDETLAAEVEIDGDGEHVLLENVSEGVVLLDEHRLRYDADRECVLDALHLMPGSKVKVTSQGSQERTWTACPPTHERGAGFEGRPLADGDGTVRLLDPEGNEVLEASAGREG